MLVLTLGGKFQDKMPLKSKSLKERNIVGETCLFLTSCHPLLLNHVSHNPAPKGTALNLLGEEMPSLPHVITY